MASQLRAAAPRFGPAHPRGDVLVVEDDADHLRTVREILEEEGYRVEGAADGSAALLRLLHGPLPDMILLDLMLPVMDGWSFVAELKRRPELAGIPVVVMTGAGDRALMSAPVSAGYIGKPINSARLLETLAACLVRRTRTKSGSHPIER